MLLEHTTIKEIAERANVSTATVSRILNGKHCHRSSTVETVRRAIEELRAEGPVLTGFETAAAESVGIMMFSYRDFLNTNYTATLVTAMVEALTAEDLSAQLLTLSSKRLSIGYIESMIRAHRLRGLLIPEFDILYAISEKLVKLPIPVIGIGNLAEPGLPNCVCADNTGAGRDAANYLWSMGHRRFGLLSMAYSDICQRQRITGFRDTIQELGGNPGQVWSRQYRSQDDSVSGAVSELANMKNPPTAILSTNSQITLKLQSGLVQAGFRIPDRYLAALLRGEWRTRIPAGSDQCAAAADPQSRRSRRAHADQLHPGYSREPPGGAELLPHRPRKRAEPGWRRRARLNRSAGRFRGHRK